MNIFITGTSSGIGAALAHHFCSMGHQVQGLSRRANEDLIKFPNFKQFQKDLADFDALEDYLPSVFEYWDSFDLVILNAGLLGKIDFLPNQKYEDIRKIMDVNVWANKIIIDALLESKIPVKQVVAISSGAAYSGMAAWGPYSISKAALNALIQTYASENSQIHFSALAPGIIDTAMQDYIAKLDANHFTSVQGLQEVKGTSHMPKPMEAAQHIADAIHNLKSLDSGAYYDIRKI